MPALEWPPIEAHKFNLEAELRRVWLTVRTYSLLMRVFLLDSLSLGLSVSREDCRADNASWMTEALVLIVKQVVLNIQAVQIPST